MDLLTANDTQGTYPASYYQATTQMLEVQPSLEEDTDCDVCIIGAGYTGLSAALHLADSGMNVLLLDAHRIGWGASGRNGGQLGSGQRLDQEQLESMLGQAKAHSLWDLAEESKHLVHGLIKRHAIECDYQAGIMHVDHRRRFVEGSKTYAAKLEKDYGYDKIRFLDQPEVRSLMESDAYFGGTLDMGAGHLHPLDLALGLGRAALKAGVRVFENTKVTGLEAGNIVRVSTQRSCVNARFVLLACNGYLGQLDQAVARRVMPINNFVIATSPMPQERAQSLIRNRAAIADSKFVVNYFRLSKDNRLLFGGGENYGYRFPDDIKSFVRKHMLQIYPQLSDVDIEYGWGGTLGITMNRMPHLARLAPNILSASGYSGHGIGMATLCGKLASEAIAGTASRFDLMASIPSPRFPGGAAFQAPLLALAMLYFSLRDRF